MLQVTWLVLPNYGALFNVSFVLSQKVHNEVDLRVVVKQNNK